MQKRYIILDDDSKSILKIQSVMERFSNFSFIASAATYDEGLNLILEFQPDFVFLEVNPQLKTSQLSLLLINELHRYLTKIPKIIAISADTSHAYEALKYDVADYLIKPITEVDLRKTFLRIQKNEGKPTVESAKEIIATQPIVETQVVDSVAKQQNFSSLSELSVSELHSLKNEIASFKEALIPVLANVNTTIDHKEITDLIVRTIAENLTVVKDFDWTAAVNDKIAAINTIAQPIVNPEENKRKLICIKSYGDYRFLELDDLAFLQADNNSTDITIKTGEQITAFKTLKYFEENLPANFYRIHNSYIVNKDYISRIHTGNSLCYIKNTKIQIPFSKSYKDTIDLILTQLAGSEHKES